MIDLHIIPCEKSTALQIRFYREHFPAETNPFIVYGDFYPCDVSIFENVSKISLSKRDFGTMVQKMKTADRIHIHGLFEARLFILLAIHKRIAKKCNWFIWGDDLYSLTREKNDLRGKLYRSLRVKALSNLGAISTNVRGDYKIACKVTKASPVFYELGYTSMNIRDVVAYESANERQKKTNQTIRILLGNSATPSNQHKEALDKLALFKDKDIQLFVPLSYGDKEYSKRVETYGKELFGDKFTALVDFMPLNEYIKLLDTMDVAIFANNRQQGLGNILPLLYLGKKVYIRKDTTTWDSVCDEYGIRMYAYESIENESFEQFMAVDFDADEQKKKVLFLSDDDMAIESFKKCLVSENL